MRLGGTRAEGAGCWVVVSVPLYTHSPLASPPLLPCPVRCRWFESQGTHRNPSAAPPLVVRDGVLGSVPSSGPGTLTHTGAGSAATGKAAGTTQTAAATTATTATAATAATASSSHATGPASQAPTTRPAGQGFGSTSAVQAGFKGLAPQGSSSVSAAAVLGRAPEPLIPPMIDPISEDQLERVQEAREMFIRQAEGGGAGWGGVSESSAAVS